MIQVPAVYERCPEIISIQINLNYSEGGIFSIIVFMKKMIAYYLLFFIFTFTGHVMLKIEICSQTAMVRHVPQPSLHLRFLLTW